MQTLDIKGTLIVTIIWILSDATDYSADAIDVDWINNPDLVKPWIVVLWPPQSD